MIQNGKSKLVLNNQRINSTVVLFSFLTISLALRLTWASVYHGFLTGDDVEILESAFDQVGLINYEPWTIRSLFLPKVVIAPVLWVAKSIGFHSTRHLIFIARVPVIIIGILSIWLLFHIAHALTKDKITSLVSASLFSFHTIPLAFGSTVYPRVVSTFFILCCCYVGLKVINPYISGTCAGIFFSLAFACRYSEIIYLIPILFLFYKHTIPNRGKKKLTASFVLSSVLFGCIFIGFFDYITWGKWFASLRQFFIYTLVEKKASAQIPNQPLFWYIDNSKKWIPIFYLIPSILSFRKKGSLISWVFIVIPLLVLSSIHHKEIRYLQGIVPFICLATGIGVHRIYRYGLKYIAIILVLCAVFNGVRQGNKLLSNKSTAAVEAALDLIDDDAVKTIALSQPWAYGDLLYFAKTINFEVLPPSPSPSNFTEKHLKVDRICIFKEDLNKSPTLHAFLESNGFSKYKSYHKKRGKHVLVYKKKIIALRRQVPSKLYSELRSPFFPSPVTLRLFSNVNGTSSRALAKRPYTGCEKTQVKNAPGAPDPPAAPVSHGIKSRHRYRYRDRHRDRNRPRPGYNVYLYSQEKSLTS